MDERIAGKVTLILKPNLNPDHNRITTVPTRSSERRRSAPSTPTPAYFTGHVLFPACSLTTQA